MNKNTRPRFACGYRYSSSVTLDGKECEEGCIDCGEQKGYRCCTSNRALTMTLQNEHAITIVLLRANIPTTSHQQAAPC